MKNLETIISTSSVEVEKPTKVRKRGLSLIFLMTFICILDRSNYGVTTSSMMKDLNINVMQMGIATSLFSLAYALIQIPGSLFVRKYGTRITIAVSVALWSVFTLTTGLSVSFGSLILSRILFGIAEGPVFPAANKYILHWFPLKDRAFANAIPNTGSWLALIVAPPLMVWLMGLFGWRSVFYFCSVIGLIGATLWFLFTRDIPEEHAGVNKAELEYIQSGGTAVIPKKSTNVPWGKFFKSQSFWGLAIAYFASVYMYQYFVYWLPLYLQNELHMSIKTMGYASSVPWMFIFVAGMSVGRISDWLVRKEYSLFVARNGLILLGFIGSALFMYISTFMTNPWAVVLLLSLAVGFIGFNMTIPWAIASDIAGENTGVVSSWMNTWGQVGAAIMATLSAYIGSTFGWKFTILSLVAIAVLGVIGTLMIRPERRLS